MSVYSTSLLEDPLRTNAESREADFADVLDAALDPALQMCEKMAEMRPSSWDRAVFGINCTETVLDRLEAFEFTHSRRVRLEQEEDAHIEQLIAEHVSDSQFGFVG